MSVVDAQDPGPAIPVEAISPYVPRIVMRQLVQAPQERSWTLEGSVVFVDISGFTKLSEKLARAGKEGAEQVTDTIGSCFAELLSVAYANGGGLLKFGGDALLLFFEGPQHEIRAAASAVGMRAALRTVGRIDLPGAKINLRMSVGAHTGTFPFFLVGSSHREPIVAGPAWSTAVQMEHDASAGQIRVGPDLAASLPASCLGAADERGALLVRAPGGLEPVEDPGPPPLDAATIASCLSPGLRAHVAGGGGAAEHRPTVIAFLRFAGIDATIAEGGVERAAADLDALVRIVQSACDEQGVCFLGSDVDADGGKLILTCGAPVNTGSDEERMLLAVRAIADARPPLPVSIGVNRGHVFAGDIGPWYRRTYTVMGDDVNLAARLMAQAEPGRIFATADVLDRSATRFETTELPPFRVKGKAKPVRAWTLGDAVRARARDAEAERFPFSGRETEMAMLAAKLEAVHAGDGRLAAIVGDAGIGKTRVVEELRERSVAAGLRPVRATCEAFTASTAYQTWRELLRELIGVGYDDPDGPVLERIEAVTAADPELVPWVPLIGRAIGIEVPATPEVEMLTGDEFVRRRLHGSVARFLELAAPGPVLFEVEDVHHMDDASAALLGYVADHLRHRPWLVCVTRRPEGRGFVAEPGSRATTIELDALSTEATAALAATVAERFPMPPHLLATVAERSGGNPQFLLDLAPAAAASGGAQGLPRTAEAAAMARIDRLSPQDRTMVRRASVLGMSLHLPSLPWVLDARDPGPDEATWVRLSEIFERQGDGYVRFRQALLRDAAYEGLPFRLRRSLHTLMVERMEASLDPEDELEALSLHSFLGGLFDEAWDYGRRAGDRALGLGVPSEAARFYRRALDAARARHAPSVSGDDRAAVMEALGRALLRAGELEEASRVFAQARRLRADDPLAAARLLLEEAYVAERVGRTDLVVRRARRAASVLGPAEGPEAEELRGQAGVSEAAARQIQGRTADAARLSRETLDRAVAVGDRRTQADASVVLDWALTELGRAGEATHLPEAVEIYEAANDLHSAASAYNAMGGVAYFQGRWDEAVGFYQRMVDMKERLGDPVHAANGSLNIAEVLSDQGHWEDAQERLRNVLRVARGAGEDLLVGYATAYLGRVATRSGRGEEALELLTRAREALEAQGAAREVEQVDSWLAEAALFCGRWEEAARAAEASLGKDGVSDALLYRIRGEALARLGQEEDAHAALDRSLSAAEEEGSVFERLLTQDALVRLWPGAPDADALAQDARDSARGLGIVRIAAPPPGGGGAAPVVSVV